jgi:hypothetical protein
MEEGIPMVFKYLSVGFTGMERKGVVQNAGNSLRKRAHLELSNEG